MGYKDIVSREKDNIGYDLEARGFDGSLVCVEVKGTTTAGDAVILTANEYRYAKEQQEKNSGRNLMLIIVTNLKVTEGEHEGRGCVRTEATRVRCTRHWNVDDHGEAIPTEYRYHIKDFDGG